MAGITMEFPISASRDWRTALSALGKLLRDESDTAQVFRIMRALNVNAAQKGYERLLRTSQGGRIAYEGIELAQKLSDPAYVASFAPGSVGAAYREFLGRTGFSADGLAMVSRVTDELDQPHPHAWYGRRLRDTHDVWHTLTGYRADDPLGEACLVGFSYGQGGGLGWALIAVGSAFKALRQPRGWRAVRAIWEGYRLGRRAAWLPGEDYERLFDEPLATARRRLRIGRPERYWQVDATLAR